jgi:hypothetical protein
MAASPVVAPAGPTTPEKVATWLQLGGDSSAAAGKVEETVLSVNDLLRDFLTAPADGQPWRWRYTQGATMLAGRLFRRRNSALGVAAFQAEGAAYVQRNDPDIAMQLGIGAYTPPRVG